MSDLSSFLSTRNTQWSDKLWDGLIEAINARLAPLEENLGIQREVADAIIARGLTVIEQELAPIVAQAGDILDETLAEVIAKLTRFESKVTGGTVLTTSASPATLITDATINLIIDASDREFFAITPHIALSRASTTANWAIGKVLSYTRSTGALSLKVEQAVGAGGPYSDWVITSLPAATLIQKTFYEQTVVLRGQVADDKSDAGAAREAAQDARDAAILAAGAAEEVYDDLRIAVAPPVMSPTAPALGQIWYDGTTMRVFDGDDFVPVAPWNALTAVSYEAQLLSNIQMAQARANIGADLLAGHRNKLINGGLALFQRGLSIVIAAGNSAYVADRWRITNGTNRSVIVARVGIALSETLISPQQAYKMTLTFASAPTSGTIRIAQRIESVRTLAGEAASARAYLSGPIGSEVLACEVVQSFGTGGSPSSPVTTPAASIDIATIYDAAKKERRAQFVVPAVSAKLLGTGGDDYLELAWVLTPRQAGAYEFARPSLVAGDASAEEDPFSPRSPGSELLDCERFFEKSYNMAVAPGTMDSAGQIVSRAVSTGGSAFPVRFRTWKRATPVLTVYNPSTGGSGTIRDATTSVDVASSPGSLSEAGYDERATVVDTRFYSWHYTVEAEL